ncbi:hypothetical protein GSI_03723 [Ganoderma sinense ZZ0214-1]|uniref:C2H2-type domain-containing protein n=1 Tax=Ganoderma sinense ZZ0214-1 TaxID=1077348 RepID=A0A2G8SJR7_9APHY|nr:hypothetical protein GSI_03723 [Ganoderma sinense ZZ0214-1]
MFNSGSYPCRNIGCTKSFGGAIGRGVHEKSCKHRLSGVRKRMAEGVKAIHQARKRARLHAQETGGDSEWEDVDESVGEDHAKLSPLEIPLPPPAPLAPAPASPPTVSTRGGRRLRIPKKYDDMVPSSRSALPSQYAPLLFHPSPSPQRSPTTPSSFSSSSSEEEEEFESTPDAFGVFRRYFREPQALPDDDSVLEDVCDSPGLEGSNSNPSTGYTSILWLSRMVAITVDDDEAAYGPFANASQFRLFDYFYDRTEVRSHAAFDDLMHVLRSDGFSVDDLDGFSARQGE